MQPPQRSRILPAASVRWLCSVVDLLIARQFQLSILISTGGVHAIFDPHFTDKVYEAALVPSLWKNVLDGLALASNSVGTVLHSATDQHSSTIYSDSLAPFMAKSSEWFGRNIRTQLLLKLPNSEFHSDADHFSSDQMNSDWLYKDYLIPLGLGYAAATWIKVPNGDNLILSIERSHLAGAFTRSEIDALTAMRPHIARSAMLAARLDAERIRTANNVFEAVGMPAAALTSTATVLDCNQSFTALGHLVGIGARDRLQLKNIGAQARLVDALAKESRSLDPVDGLSFPITAPGNAPAVVHLIPVRRIARDLFSRAVVFMVVTPVGELSAPPMEIIQGLFDLTTAEARVAHALASGSDVSSIAEAQSVSRETVRHHLKGIFAKTGYDRQSDFVAAISSLPALK